MEHVQVAYLGIGASIVNIRASLIAACCVIKTPVPVAHVHLDDGGYFVRTLAMKDVHAAALVLERAHFLVSISQV